jgi:hypothetical protein
MIGAFFAEKWISTSLSGNCFPNEPKYSPMQKPEMQLVWRTSRGEMTVEIEGKCVQLWKGKFHL